MATSGPGAIHLLNGLYDAKLDHQPVVAIVGQQKTISLGANYQQEVDLQVLFKDVASEFCVQISSPSAARHVVDRAFRVAQASRSVACIIVPANVQEQAYGDPRARTAPCSAAAPSRARTWSRATPTCAARPRSSTPAGRSRC
jgi:pyruvate dehydrogenase (quinone)